MRDYCSLTSRAIEEYYKPLYPIAYESFVRTDTAGTPASMQVALGKDPWMLPGLGLRFFQQSDVDWVRKGEMRHIDGRQTLQTVYRLNLRPRANIAPHFAVQRAPLPPVVTTLAILIPTVYCGKKDEAEGALATRNALITVRPLLPLVLSRSGRAALTVLDEQPLCRPTASSSRTPWVSRRRPFSTTTRLRTHAS